MLTREEYEKFIEDLKVYNLENYTTQEIRNIIDAHLFHFVEKQKREIQVGDIYLDGNKLPRPIVRIDPNEKYPLNSSHYDCYTYDGKFDVETGASTSRNKRDLDLSKRYKLVEIEE